MDESPLFERKNYNNKQRVNELNEKNEEETQNDTIAESIIINNNNNNHYNDNIIINDDMNNVYSTDFVQSIDSLENMLIERTDTIEKLHPLLLSIEQSSYNVTFEKNTKDPSSR